MLVSRIFNWTGLIMVKPSENPPTSVLCHPWAHSDHPDNPCGYRGAATSTWGRESQTNTGMLVLPRAEQTQAHIQQGRCTLWHLLWSICLPEGHCSTSPGIFLPFGVNMQLYRVPTPPFLTLYFQEILYLVWPEDVLLGFWRRKEAVS